MGSSFVPRARSQQRKRSPSQRAKEEGYRSASELKVKEQLTEVGVEFTYEKEVLRFTQPEKKRRYTPDFILITKGTGKRIVIEVKGLFTTADRQKHLWLAMEYPDMDLRFVFDRSKSRISKTSKTTYADWCQKNRFQFADKLIPEEWLNE